MERIRKNTLAKIKTILPIILQCYTKLHPVQTFGPPVIGALSDAYSYVTGIGVLGAVLLLAAIGCVIALVRQRHSAQSA